MKTYLLLLSAFVAHTVATAQPWKSRPTSLPKPPSQLRLEETVSRSTKSEYYFWSAAASSYVPSSTSTYTYDSKGNVLTQETRTVGSNAIFHTSSYAYDQAGNIIFSENIFIYGGEVENGDRYTREYDGNDMVYGVSESYSSSTKKWKIREGAKLLREKDSKGNILKEISQEADTNGQFYNTTMVEYTYDASNQISSVLSSNWDGLKWVPIQKYTDIVWHNSEKNEPTSYMGEAWNGTAWADTLLITGALENGFWVVTTTSLKGGQSVPVYRRSISDQAIVWANGVEHFSSKGEMYTNGNWKTAGEYMVTTSGDTLVIESSSYDIDQSGAFMGGSRYRYTYNSKGNMVRSLSLTLDKNGTEQLSNGDVRRYSYDPNGNVLSLEIDNYNSQSNTFEKANRIVYSDFATFEVTGILTTGKSEVQFSVFPNPSSNGLFKLQEPAQFSVFDSQGQKLFEEEGNVVDLSTHKKGIYFIQLDTPKGKVSKKLILE